MENLGDEVFVGRVYHCTKCGLKWKVADTLTTAKPMSTSNDPLAAPLDDDALRAELTKHVPDGAHPTTLDKSFAFYREIEQRPFAEIAILMALQQIMLEGLTTALEKRNSDDQAKMSINDVSKGGIIKPTRIKRRY